jgi:two-component system, NtrC family, sensor kinase
MRRRSGAGGEPIKTRRRKAMTLKRLTSPRDVRRRNSSDASQETEIARLTRELKEALEQKTATSEVLRVISSSPGKLEPVFQAMLEKATRLCEAPFGGLFLRDAGLFRLVASHVPPSAPAAIFQPGSQLAVSDNAIHPLVRMIDSKAVAHIADMRTDRSYVGRNPRIVAFVETVGARTVLCVPMLKDNEYVGAFIIFRQEVRPFTDKQIELVQNFAAQAVIAIENTRLLSELRESLEQQTATSEVLQVISSSPGDLQPVFDAMLANAVRICDAKFGNIHRWDGEAMHLVATHNIPLAFAEARRRSPMRPDPGNPIGRMVATKAVVHVADLPADERYIERRDPDVVAAVELGGVRTFVAVPMLKENKLIGAVIVYRQEVRPFTDKQIALVTSFAAQAVIAIENARLLKELRESLEQQTATSEVLKVISSSPGELKPVFDAMLESATRICGATFGSMLLRDGDAYRRVALHNAPQRFLEFNKDAPIRWRGTALTVDRAIDTRQAVHVLDVAAEDPNAAVAKFADARTLLVVPMLKENEAIGVIGIYRQEVRPFSNKQIELVTNFAAQAVIAIENARLLNELRQRTDELGRSIGELRALGEVSRAVNSTLNLETVLSTIVTKAVQLSGTEAGAIYVFDDRQREFCLRATYGMDQELIDALTQRRIGMDDPNVAEALAQPEPIQVADLKEEAPSDINEITLRAGYRARLVAPLLRGEDVVGLLVVRRRTPGTFPQNTVELIKTFAAQSAVAIENARLFQNVETSLEDLRTAQDRLIQTEKLASLGQLTAGIAHEIKNPLNFVNNFSAVSVELIDELREALGSVHLDSKLRAEIGEIADTLQGNLDKVVQHGKRADAIVKNMLLHSRQGSGEHRPVDINALVEESLNLAYHGARAEKQGFNITLERSFDPAAGEVDLFPQEITRALLNLISNGFYAATKRKAEANGGDYEPTLAAATKNLGDRVEIRIRDNGTGIPPEVKEKLFNPFFTTKPAGEGTGLGLSISHDIIVKQHGGYIEVDTQPGEFTEFRIVLPRASASLMKSGERM